MIKVKIAVGLVALAINSLAMAGSLNNFKGVQTYGTAEIPSQVKVIKDGIIKVYFPAFESNEFRIMDDNYFSMGSSTRCDPYIGQTDEDLRISLVVTKRVITDYDSKSGKSQEINAGPVGKAVVIIPRGSNVYGRCQGGTTNLEAITIQLANPQNGHNVYDRNFEIQWGTYDVTVKSVSCASGAVVNLLETVSEGEKHPMTDAFASAMIEANGGMILKHKISSQGFEYKSGQPPCPTGDTLVVEFSQ